jgi:hypothetical protein
VRARARPTVRTAAAAQRDTRADRRGWAAMSNTHH